MSGRTKRIAWVTGGASGIGQAAAEALAADGWTVVISGRRPDALAATAQKVRASGGVVDVFPLDVTNADEIAAVTDAILAKHGRIDLLVNSAGLNLPKRSWEDMELKGWDQIVDVNLNGLLYCMRAVLPAMRAQKDGCIINVASWAGRIVSQATGPAYNATKHAVLPPPHSFTRAKGQNGLRPCCLCQLRSRLP